MSVHTELLQLRRPRNQIIPEEESTVSRLGRPTFRYCRETDWVSTYRRASDRGKRGYKDNHRYSGCICSVGQLISTSCGNEKGTALYRSLPGVSRYCNGCRRPVGCVWDRNLSICSISCYSVHLWRCVSAFRAGLEPGAKYILWFCLSCFCFRRFVSRLAAIGPAIRTCSSSRRHPHFRKRFVGVIQAGGL